MKKALTIAGSDSSGGAGIQADIKTMTANGVYAMSAITALTAQNTTGVTDILEVSPAFLCAQLDAVFTDIYPDAVKIGMLSGVEIMEVVAQKLREYKARHVVLDPVMVATSGSRLMKANAVDCMVNKLFPLAEIITPNIPEAEVLTGMTISTREEICKAGKLLYQQANTAVLIKGGHSEEDANDMLFYQDKMILIEGRRIDNPNTHGTGCTLSSAIASNLAKGMELENAVRAAKEYLTGALKSQLNLGAGSGPVNHIWNMENQVN